MSMLNILVKSAISSIESDVDPYQFNFDRLGDSFTRQ